MDIFHPGSRGSKKHRIRIRNTGFRLVIIHLMGLCGYRYDYLSYPIYYLAQKPWRVQKHRVGTHSKKGEVSTSCVNSTKKYLCAKWIKTFWCSVKGFKKNHDVCLRSNTVWPDVILNTVIQRFLKNLKKLKRGTVYVNMWWDINVVSLCTEETRGDFHPSS